MSKIYDEKGNKMDLAQIGVELVEKIESKNLDTMKNALVRYDNIKDSSMRLAHAILDTYKNVDGTSENGMRVRKLMDNLMKKYQKSMNITTESRSQYDFIVSQIMGK